MSSYYNAGIRQQGPETTNFEEHNAVGDVSTGRRFKAVQEIPIKTLIDETATATYIGEAAFNTSTSSALWRITRIATTGTVTSIECADGNDLFDNVWDNRVSLSYS